MYRNYRPRKTSTPRNNGPDWLGWLIGVGSAVVGIGTLVWFIGSCLYYLYEAVTKGTPTWITAVAEWGDDVITTVRDHDWQFTDGVLYGGIVVILVLRYTNVLDLEPPSERIKKDGPEPTDRDAK